MDIEKLGMVTDDGTGGYYVCECGNCGHVFSSENALGGGALADTGDYDDIYCPSCNEIDPDECENPEKVWNIQQARINGLLVSLRTAEQERDQYKFWYENETMKFVAAADELNVLRKELETLRAQLKAAQEQEPELFATYGHNNGPVILELFGLDEKECKNKILNLAKSEGYKGTLSGYLLKRAWQIRPLYAAPIPAQQSPAVAVYDSFRKVIFEQPDEAKELVIGVDDNDCPYFILGAQKFRLDPTVIENREHAKWYQKQLSIAFERFTTDAHIQPSPRITDQDARKIIKEYLKWSDSSNNSHNHFEFFKSTEGRALLDKLNKQ